MRLPFRGPQGREISDGTTIWSASPTGNSGATAGAKSGSLLELRWSTVGRVSQAAAADPTGRGGPVHAGGAALPNGVLHAVPSGVSTRGGRRTGAAARGVRTRRDRAGRAAPLSRASERPGDPPGAGATGRRARRADGREPDRAVRGVGGAAADRSPPAAGSSCARGRRGARIRWHAAGRGHEVLWVIR